MGVLVGWVGVVGFSFLSWLVGVVVVVKRLGRLKEEESLSLRDRSWSWVTSGMSPADLTEGPAVPSRMAPLAGRGRLGGAATMSRETWRRGRRFLWKDG